MKYFFIFCLASLVACSTKKRDQEAIPETLTTEQQLKKAILRYPDSLLLTENLVQYYRETGNYDKAFEVVKEAIKKDSLNARWWDIKAILHMEDADTLQSIRSFEKAIEILPAPQYVMALGTLYAQTKNGKAIKMADALLSADQAKAEKEAYFIKGLYYSFINEKQRAISFFDKCLSLSYTYMGAYLEKSLALYDLEKYPEALAVLDKAVTLQNNFDEGYYFRGRCLEKLNRPKEAIESYQRALMYDPGYLEAKDALARLNAD